jgi:nucleoid-associated protein YgaU
MATKWQGSGQGQIPKGLLSGLTSSLPAPVPDGAPGPLEPPRYGWVRLCTVDRSLDLTLRLDEDPPALTPQLPRLEQVEIAYRAARSWWSGQAPGELSISVLLDGYPQKSIEAGAQILERMGRPVSAGKASGMPSPIQIAGNVPGADRLWVITQLDSGDAIWRHGFRVRQHWALGLAQWLPLEQADTGGRKNPRTAAGALKKRQPVTVRKGDTLTKIAQRELGSAAKWKSIAALNKVKGKARRSPSDLKVGERLKLPQG